MSLKTLRKSWPLAKGIFAQVAFQGHDGSVVGTVPFHDLDALPEGFQVAQEGFLGHDGKFLNRLEAAAHARTLTANPVPDNLHSDTPVGQKGTPNYQVVSGAATGARQAMRDRMATMKPFKSRKEREAERQAASKAKGG